VNAPPGGQLTSFDFAAVDSNLGLFFLADRGTASTLNNGIQVLNTRTTDHKFGMFNQPSYQTTLCQGKFTGTGVPTRGENGTNRGYKMGPNGLVVVNSRAVWAGDGNSTIKVCSLGGVLLKTISTNGNGRVGRGCFDPVHQTVLFANDLERNFDHQTSFPFFSIYDARTYAFKAKKTLDSGYLDAGGIPSYLSAMYTGSPAVHVAATSGVGSCIYETNTGHFWVAIPECYNQTARLASLSTFHFKNGGGTVATTIHTAKASSGGDPNAGHGCVAEINPTDGSLIAVFDVGAPAFPNPSAGPNPGQPSSDSPPLATSPSTTWATARS